MKFARLLLLLLSMNAIAQDNYNLVIGTYTNACESKGIYVYDFNVNTLSFKEKNSTVGVINPSYLTVNKSNNIIYSVNEDGAKSDVSAFKYTPSTGKLQPLNKKDSEGADPCYIINDDKNVIVANYSGGSIAVFGKKSDGGLTDAKQVVKHTGSSVNKQRQEKAHVHMVYFSPDKKYVFSNDLGEDKIYIYNYNADGGSNTLTLKQIIDVKPGSGPRHLAFNPNGIFFYVINELSATIDVYSYSYEKPAFLQQVSLFAKDCNDANSAADIRFSKDGKYLYATNRGDANTITVFKVHSNGMINQVQQITTLGEGPRNFTIDPSDNYVLVAHQYSHNIIIFKRDKTTGMLTETGKKIDVCSPVCLMFTANK
ncbi:lactonase family protein [Flavobacterium hauense]